MIFLPCVPLSFPKLRTLVGRCPQRIANNYLMLPKQRPKRICLSYSALPLHDTADKLSHKSRDSWYDNNYRSSRSSSPCRNHSQ